ncbi:leukocyte surface antigen CD53-like [Centruroides sculpturatus]|uniref:leukocyte surface antigen CD53-like n=1 Tax=Centruroides sculpturatus TaxID=218467 RepID=UPI000C6D9869|nr:leukocyte surface antigen CD53-like [Centruroides sculpturatus]
MRRFAKTVMFVLNFIVSFCGAVGAVSIFVTKFSIRKYNIPVGSEYHLILTTLIALAILMFLLAILGCCGTMLDNMYILNSYSSWLLLIVIIQVSIGIYITVNKKQMIEAVKGEMLMSMKKFRAQPHIRKGWNLLQTILKCCGIKQSSDWLFAFKSGKLPISCCPRLKLEDEEQCTLGLDSHVAEGCFEKLVVIIKRNITEILILIFTTIIFEIINIIFGFYLVYKIAQDRFYFALMTESAEDAASSPCP